MEYITYEGIEIPIIGEIDSETELVTFYAEEQPTVKQQTLF